MKQATLKKQDKPALGSQLSHRLREALLIVTAAMALYLLLALASYHHTDPGWSSTGTRHAILNAGGRAGAWFSDFFLYLFGYMAYTFPLMLVYSAWMFMKNEAVAEVADYRGVVLRALGVLATLLAGCALSSLELGGHHTHLPYTSGGIFGNLIAEEFVKFFNSIGATLILLTIFASGFTLFAGFSWLKCLDFVGRITLNLFSFGKNKLADATSGEFKFAPKFRREPKEITAEITPDPTLKVSVARKPQKVQKERVEPKFSEAKQLAVNAAVKPRLQISDKLTKIEPSVRAQKDKQLPLFNSLPTGDLPSISLLDQPEPTGVVGYSSDKLESMSREVEERLKDFGVDVHVVAVHPGPVITRIEMQLAPGIKVSRISGLAKDLARSLSVTSVRIVEVIPGKPVVGLEVPNEHRETVRLSEIIASQQYEQIKSPLALTLGKDIAGHPVIVDLAKMPHLLVAGTTGSGKSVGLNAMLLGLLYKAQPEHLRMILVDPKMLELSIYEGIPHLLTPVVTDMKEAANALRWCVGEMERRYRIMASLGVRNLSGFNTKIKDAQKRNEPILDPIWRGDNEADRPKLNTLPFIVVVIDEYADMMMVVGKKVEQLIARIAQKARAAGIHLILATQRPSVDVITGLIKANIPTRIAFQVSSKIDSRTVLDQGGAEQLLGNGDMLYLPPGTSVSVRVHGAFVADEEVHKVVSDWKRRGSPEYIEDILRGGGDSDGGEPGEFGSNDDGEQDPLYDQAIYIVTSTRRASISGIQRRLKVGYNRAARLVEEMESAGIVGPMESNGNREVLAPAPPEQ